MSFTSRRSRHVLQALTGQADGTATGDQFELAELDDAAGLVFGISVDRTAGTGTLDCDIEDSPDGTTWAVLVAFTQLTNDGGETVRATRPPGRFVRAVTVAAGAAGGIWDVTVDMVGTFAIGAVAT